MFETDKVYIDSHKKVLEFINAGKEDELKEILIKLQKTDSTIEIYPADDFKPGFLSSLEKD